MDTSSSQTSEISQESIASRVREACKDISFAELSHALGMNAETVRRQVRHGKPSIQLVLGLSRIYGWSGDWLLTGQGPKSAKQADEPDHPGQPVSEEDAVGRSIRELTARLDDIANNLDAVVICINNIRDQRTAATESRPPRNQG